VKKIIWAILLFILLPIIPKRLTSRFVGVLMKLPLIWPLNVLVLPIFARIFRIDASEAEHPYSRYGSCNAYFTRKLKAGARPIQGAFVHPCDAELSAQGTVASGQLVQAKGWEYSLGEFLGNEELAKAYEGGRFYTYYLCPADYHRVHAPRGGGLYSATHIPGELWPVNSWSVQKIPRLFNLNERVVMNFENEKKEQWSVVMVGATNVGKISISADPSISTNRWLWHAPSAREYSPAFAVNAGDEIGTFHLGSTVIVVLSAQIQCGPVRGGRVRMGSSL